MSIYISNNAIQNIPLVSEVINEKFYSDLLTSFLKENGYLSLLAEGRAESLSMNSKSSLNNPEAIKYIRAALEALDKDFQTDFELSINFYGDYNKNLFEQNLRDAIIAFQIWKQLEPTGILDKKTLIAIDQQLDFKVYVDYISKKYLGNNLSTAKINLTRSFNIGTNKYSFSFVLDNTPITIETNQVATGRIILDSSGNAVIDNGRIFVQISPEIEQIILDNPEFKNKNIKLFDGFNIPIQVEQDELKSVFIDQSNNITFSSTTIIDAITDLPPIKYDDPYEKPPYLIQPGDNFSQIIENNYYGQSLVFENPYDESNPIFTSPARQPLPIANRNDDARFQFYINLLYYYNTFEDNDGVVQEWGIKKSNSYLRYNVDHLENENIYNNVYNSSDPQSALPNYHRFLKRLEAHNSAHKILFDGSGNTTSFEIQPGKKMRIPSRQFADSLYYQLNFRQDLFLEADPDNSDKLRYKTNLFDLISNVTSTISQAIKQSIINLYNETCQFFQNAYNYAKNFLASFWPRGTGGKLGGGIGVTWGIPIATDLNVENRLWRKMTPQDEFTIMYRKEGKFGVGLDAAVGISTGLYMGKGKKKRGVGLQAAAGVSSMLNFKGVTEYEFPVRTEETALLSMVVTVFGGQITQASVSLLDYFNLINLDPDQYVTKIDFGISNDSEASGALQVGFGTPESLQAISVDGGGAITQTEETSKRFFSFKNIFKNIPGIGLSGSANISLGVGFSVEYKYDYLNQGSPLVPSIDARVPSETKVEVNFNMETGSSVQVLGGFLKRVLVSATGVVPAINTFLGFIFGNSGKELAFVFEGKRKTNAASILQIDMDISNLSSDVNVSPNNKGGLKYNNVNYEWNSYFKIGYFEGAPEDFCQPGSFSAVKLNLSKIKDIVTQNTPLDLNNALLVLYSYEKGFKLGVDGDRRNKKGLFFTQSVTNSFGKNPVGTFQVSEVTRKRQLISNVNKDIFGFDFATYLYVKVEFRMEDYLLFVKYYLRLVKLRFLVSANQNVFEEVYLKNLIKHKEEVIKAIAKKEKEAATPEALVSKMGIAYYNQLFTEGYIYNNSNLTQGMNGKIIQIINGLQTDGATVNFGDTLKHFVECYKWFKKYYSDIAVPDLEKLTYGIEQLPEIWSFAASLSRLYVALELELGVNLSAQVKAGIGELTARLAISGELALIDHSIFYEDGAFVIANDPNDPYNIALQDIRNYLVNTASNKLSAINQSVVRHKIH